DASRTAQARFAWSAPSLPPCSTTSAHQAPTPPRVARPLHRDVLGKRAHIPPRAVERVERVVVLRLHSMREARGGRHTQIIGPESETESVRRRSAEPYCGGANSSSMLAHLS